MSTLSRPRPRPRFTAAVLLGAAGVLFALYPAVRPYADETTLAGAAAMASPAWLVAHGAAMAGFVAVTVAGVLLTLTGRPGEVGRAAPTATALTGLGVALVLPYYGGETFALHAIGARAVAEADPSLLTLADDFRYGAFAVTTFAAGLLLLAAGGVALAVATWSRGQLARVAGLATGAGLLLFLPQFFTAPGLRIAHGLLLGTGLVLLAAAVLRQRTGVPVVPAAGRQPVGG